MKFFLKGFSLIFISFIIFYGCNKNPTTSNNPSGIALIDTVVNASNRDITINIPNKISITIPAGTGNGEVNLTVEEFDVSLLPDDDEKQIHSVYDVKIGTIIVFDEPLTIILPYDPLVLGDDVLSKNPGACFLDEETNQWVNFNDVSIDTTNSQVIISTNHLTKLAWYSFYGSHGYTDILSSEHFDIVWIEGNVPNNDVYHSPNANWLVGTEPHYIQDIRVYLEEAWDAYKSKGLWLPEGKIGVRILKLDEDGNTSYFGFIRISDNVQGETTQNLSPEQLLPMVCAHELQHYIQDYYYMGFFSGKYIIEWWLETLAVQGDRIVWSGKSIYEAESYANKQIVDIIAKSWDDCKKDQNYYQAGGFLAYLSALRVGTKLDIPKLIIAGGKATDISYFRTILDNQIKSSLSSTIGDEFSDYINWAYKGNGSITLPSSYVGTTPYAMRNTFEEFNRQLKFSAQVPYLAVRMPKIINQNNVGLKNVKLTLNQMSDDLSVNVYYRTDSVNEFRGELKSGESLITELPITDPKNSNTIAWLDVVVVNKSKDNTGSFDLDAELIDIFEFNYISFGIVCAVTIERTITGGDDPGVTTFTNLIGVGSPPATQNIIHQGNTVSFSASYSTGDQTTTTDINGTLTFDSIETPTKIINFSCSEKVTYNGAYGTTSSEENTSIGGINIPLSQTCDTCFDVPGDDMSNYITNVTYDSRFTNTSITPTQVIEEKLMAVDKTYGGVSFEFKTL